LAVGCFNGALALLTAGKRYKNIITWDFTRFIRSIQSQLDPLPLSYSLKLKTIGGQGTSWLDYIQSTHCCLPSITRPRNILPTSFIYNIIRSLCTKLIPLQ
jgi:hypothetical protein